MTPHEFGGFRYDPAQRALFRGTTMVPLAPKAIDTLHVLLERRGQVVERAALMRLVWPDTTVEEVGLARNISLLRKALGEDEDGGFIETVPRRGYRFAPLPEPVAVAPRNRRWLALVAAAALLAAAVALIRWQFYMPSRFLAQRSGAPALAVIPFEALSPLDTRGLDELLVAELASGRNLSVVSPSTVRRHQRMKVSTGLMGRLLGLDVLVEGTVQQAEDRLRVTARIVDVHTGRLVSAESFDYPRDGWESRQPSAARAIAASVRAHLSIEQAFSKPSH